MQIDRREFAVLLGSEFAALALQQRQVFRFRVVNRTGAQMNLGLWTRNLLDPPGGLTACAGDSNYVNGGGTDDTTRIRAFFANGVAAGGVPAVEAPGGRVYRITDTIDIPVGSDFSGVGGLLPNGVASPATFVWDGAAGGTMLRVVSASQNIPMTSFRNIMLTARTDGTNPPGRLIQYVGSGGFQGAADSGSYLENVWLMRGGISLDIDGGATNFFIAGGRMDDFTTSAIRAKGACSITIGNNWTAAMGKAADCIIDLDGSVADGTDLTLLGVKLETNASLNQIFAGGVNPFDKRALIRLRVNPALSYVQHHVNFNKLVLKEPFTDALGANILSHSLFGITGTSGDGGLDIAKMVSIAGLTGVGLARGSTDAAANWETRIVGGNLHATKRPPGFATGNFGLFQYGLGTVGEPIVNWIQSALI